MELVGVFRGISWRSYKTGKLFSAARAILYHPSENYTVWRCAITVINFWFLNRRSFGSYRNLLSSSLTDRLIPGNERLRDELERR